MNDALQAASICARCRASARADAKFCGSCGAKLSDGGSYVAYGLKVIATLAVIGALGGLWVQLGDGGGIHAVLQKEVASASVRPDLGLDVAVETSVHPQPPYGQYVSQITVTNLKSQPTRLEYVIINGSTDDACIKRPNQTLKEGEAYRVRSGGLFGMCGSIVRVSIRSDRGEQDYQFRP